MLVVSTSSYFGCPWGLGAGTAARVRGLRNSGWLPNLNSQRDAGEQRAGKTSSTGKNATKKGMLPARNGYGSQLPETRTPQSDGAHA